MQTLRSFFEQYGFSTVSDMTPAKSFADGCPHVHPDEPVPSWPAPVGEGLASGTYTYKCRARFDPFVDCYIRAAMLLGELSATLSGTSLAAVHASLELRLDLDIVPAVLRRSDGRSFGEFFDSTLVEALRADPAFLGQAWQAHTLRFCADEVEQFLVVRSPAATTPLRRLSAASSPSIPSSLVKFPAGFAYQMNTTEMVLLSPSDTPAVFETAAVLAQSQSLQTAFDAARALER